ncbi:MAG: rhomboid family intramembrane serine protease [candidate division KSB1 bacterium]|nr:rhomboid family intramembrane serine protease [candidate division KSB1 bacterium]MDZ7274516.1 rhomboid family intramembrane serine protease [candidate division KSB1 bacterium]MDZ7284823.1 rhomboid family intramembrane serine protease [candidate division KSB1 bacterium]MDZ7297757.1 rhomboid family intramembrane serine protease [candidate division KSB1 bacterium]MDZ7308688.1 rhomboid family intramembrane serine protease [candidate division KSB1 bacterium]
MANQGVGAIVCPNCRKLISRNAASCIHCGYRNPGLWGVGPKLKVWLEQFGFTQAVTLVCLALYALALLLDPAAIFRGRGGILQMLLGFLSPDGTVLDKLGMTGNYAMQNGRWWTLITAIYLHGSLPHIVFNLMGLHQLAPAVEELFGTSRLIVIFTFAGLAGFFLSFFAGVAFTVGASGSLFGLLGALVYYGRSRGGRFGESVYSQALQFAVIMFVYGFMMSSIVNNWAHAGGFAGGYLAAMLLGHKEKSGENDRIRLWGVAAIAVTVLAFVLAFWRAFASLA